MFPPELCRKLSDLQANAPMHSYSLSKSMIENELGMPINEAFDQFEKTPIASGSIAQIHRGVYLGQTVAVKVRHPNVEEQIMIDFDLMNAVVRIIESLPGLDWLNLSESMAQFSHTIAGQVRLDIEGKHLAMFNTNFRNWDDIYFPRPILLTESVLIESFIEGERVSDTVETLRSRAIDHELDYSHFAVTRGEDLYLKMLLQDNLMHADLHPGNIIINGVSFPGAPEPTELSARNRNRDIPIYTLTLVDAGMVATLTSEEQTNFIGLLEAMGEGRGDEAADYVLNFSSNPPKANKAFKEDMIKLFQQICKGYGTNTGVGIVLRGILNLVRIHKVTIESNYATLVMNALCLDGLSSMLLPAYNVLDGAKSLLRLNRFSRKLPRFLAKPMMKAALPIVQVVKRFEDRKFLKRLKDELQTKYTLHAVHQTSRDVQ